MSRADWRAALATFEASALLLSTRGLDSVARFCGRLAGERSWTPLDWASGVSVIIPERASPAMLEECLQTVRAAAEQVDEPVEVVVVVNGSRESDYKRLRGRFLEVQWLHDSRPLGFVAAIRRGLEAARYAGVYLLNNDMTLEADALRELLRWRRPNVFAVASQILFRDLTKRREETGWTNYRIQEGQLEIFDVLPEDEELTRGHLYAGGGSSLFHRDALRLYIGSDDPYQPFYWEDAEWGARAWRDGYEVLFCPTSRSWHRHRATVSRFFSPAEIGRIFERNGIQFQLRNFPETIHGRKWVRRVARLDRQSRRELWRLFSYWRGRLAFQRAPCRNTPLQYARRKFYPAPAGGDRERPRVLIVTPYAIYPPRHGGAVRLQRLIRECSREFELVLLCDEEALHDAASTPYFKALSAVHLVGGRTEADEDKGRRMARIRNHCHAAIASELERLLVSWQPDLVQVEFVELCDLIRVKRGREPWVLTLHDVLLSSGEGPSAKDPSPEDRFELERIVRYDAVATCCHEDAALIPGRPLVVPNGVDRAALPYRPSNGCRRILFAGPFRYAPNLEGIREFLTAVYPRLLAKVPEIELAVLGGANASAAAAALDCFQQSGVRVIDHVEDVGPWLDGALVTINPLRGIRGSSVKLIESLAAGRVCVSTTEGARGFLDAGFPSLVTVPRVEDFLDPLERLLLDDDYRHRLERPREELLQDFTWEKAGRSLTRLYRSLIEQPRSE